MKYISYPDWHYDQIARVVITDFAEIPVCTQRCSRSRAFFISRVGEAEWKIAPVQFLPGKVPQPAPFDDAGRHYDFIYLSGAPKWVNDAMAELYENGNS